MANTVTILSYANTFGDWIVTTNALVKENNDLAANNYVKTSGTLYLNDSALGLQVANTAIIAGQLQVSGIGSSAYIQNNLRVDQQVYFTNTSLGLTNTGQMNVGGIILALASGTGLAVSNNATIGGTFTVTGQSNLNGVTYVNNDLYVSGNTNISNTVQITGTTTVSNDVIITGNTSVSKFVYVTKDLFANNVTASYYSLANTLIANVATISPSIYSDKSFSNTFTANVSTVSPLIYSNIVYANTVSSNVIVYTPTLNVTGTEYVDTIKANTLITVPTIEVATNVNANTASGYFNTLKANSISSTNLNLTTLNVTGTEYVDTIKANTSISVPSANVTALLDANLASGYFNTLQTNGQFTVGGNFVINGSTVYNSNVFTLNAGSTIGLASEFDVNRGITGANASIRWNESQTYWDIKDVSTGTYYQVLTAQQLNNTVTSTSTVTAATAAVANILNNSIISTNTYLSGLISTANSQANYATTVAQAAFNKANTESGIFNGTSGQATPTSGVITFSSTNGITITGSSNTLTVNTPQDVRTSASPTFNALTLTNALGINQGGTGATSSSSALTNLLPTGTTSGYVLTTGGPGSFYWAAGGGGGGGSTPGTSINSTRLSYTGNASNTAFTAPTYTPGASQLRVYIDGVRQFPSAYTETSNTVVTLSTAPPLNSNILLEVDGYIVNPYYANNIAFTVNSNISGTANTIQLAIDGLTSKVVTNYALQTFAQAAYNQANTATTQTIPISQGGTGATSSTQALANLLPAGGTAGQTLTTNGAGSYYWAANTGGAGGAIGTTIQTTRIYPTVNAAQTLYTTPTYTPGAGQLRVYINGVRQFGSEYTETSNTSVTLSTGTSSGDTVLLEVDGYINNPYYANTIAFTINSNISSTANTIQLALDGLASKVVTYYANTSSSYTNPTWLPSVSLANLANTANALTTTASYQVGSFGVGTAASGISGEIRAANNITAYYSSDISLKENVNDITNALDIVCQIGGKTFDWTDNYIREHGGEDDYFLRKSDFGVIAQDVQKVFPLAVRTRSDGLLAVDYEKLCTLAFAAIKELKDEIEILKGNSK
jgi:hypothetical protein